MKLIFVRHVTLSFIALFFGAVLQLSTIAYAENFVFSEVTGGGGVPLNVTEGGSPLGKEILFIHGVSQSYLSWLPQLNSDQLKGFRLVAFDLRGHGNSAKPWNNEDYADSRIWADDVAAVMAAKKAQGAGYCCVVLWWGRLDGLYSALWNLEYRGDKFGKQ